VALPYPLARRSRDDAGDAHRSRCLKLSPPRTCTGNVSKNPAEAGFFVFVAMNNYPGSGGWQRTAIWPFSAIESIVFQAASITAL
jgi:hypothetical protein